MIPYVVVRCSQNQWGNDTMQALALGALKRFPAAEMAQVIEHGGWTLSYDRDAKVVDTANDMALPTAQRIAFWKRVNANGGLQLLAEIRGEALT